MQKAGLGYAQLKRYVPILMRTELLTTSNLKNSIVYETTRKGKDFLKNHAKTAI
jgi:predicted transcriptional regulator